MSFDPIVNYADLESTRSGEASPECDQLEPNQRSTDNMQRQAIGIFTIDPSSSFDSSPARYR